MTDSNSRPASAPARTCTVNVFGRLAPDLDTRNYWRGVTVQDCECDECEAYWEACALEVEWRELRNRLLTFDTVGPVEDYS